MLKQEGHNVGQPEVKKQGFSLLNILAPIVVVAMIGGGIFYVTQNTMGTRNEDYATKVQKMLEAKQATEQGQTATEDEFFEEAKKTSVNKS